MKSNRRWKFYALFALVYVTLFVLLSMLYEPSMEGVRTAGKGLAACGFLMLPAMFFVHVCERMRNKKAAEIGVYVAACAWLAVLYGISCMDMEVMAPISAFIYTPGCGAYILTILLYGIVYSPERNS